MSTSKEMIIVQRNRFPLWTLHVNPPSTSKNYTVKQGAKKKKTYSNLSPSSTSISQQRQPISHSSEARITITPLCSP